MNLMNHGDFMAISLESSQMQRERAWKTIAFVWMNDWTDWTEFFQTPLFRRYPVSQKQALLKIWSPRLVLSQPTPKLTANAHEKLAKMAPCWKWVIWTNHRVSKAKHVSFREGRTLNHLDFWSTFEENILWKPTPSIHSSYCWWKESCTSWGW